MDGVNRLNICASPNSYDEVLTLNMAGFGDGVSIEVIKAKGGYRVEAHIR